MSTTAPAARHWRTLEDGRVRCEVCPRRCTLREGQAGLCGVRRRAGDRLVLDAYGWSSGFCVDPIEKKPLHHFYPGSSALSFGTVGCNLACKFCQNSDLSRARDFGARGERATPAEIARAACDHGCRSVALTYNDPTIFLEFAADVARACHELGVAAVAVTAGYIEAAARADLYETIDAANVDLKAFTDDFYRRVTGARLAPVLETLEYLCRHTSVWTEITTLLIPGYNDSSPEIGRLCDWVVRALGPDVPLHFSAFHPAFRMLDVPRTPPETLTRARAIARAAGLRFVYTGNVRDRAGSTTACASCGAAVLVRDGFALLEYRLDAEGRCERCGSVLPGHYGPRPERAGVGRGRPRIG